MDNKLGYFPRKEFISLIGVNKIKTNILNHVLEPRKPFFLILLLTGSFPLLFPKNKEPKFKIFSAIFVYSLAIYSLIAFGISYGYIHVPGFYSGFDTLSNITKSLGDMGYFSKFLLIPIFIWIPALKIKTNLRMYKQFLENFYKITGDVLDLKELYRKSILASLLIPSLTFLAFGSLILSEFPVEDALILLPISYIPFVTYVSLTAVWGIAYFMLAECATQITKSLKLNLKQLKFESVDKKVETIRQHKSLFLELTRLFQHSNDVSTVTFAYHTAHIFTMITITLYAVLYGALTKWDGYLTGRSMLCLGYFIELWFIANAAHYTSLKFEEIFWDPELIAPDIKRTHPLIIKEINAMLDLVILAPHKVNFGGYVILNRNWLTQLTGNLLSFLILLLQFQVQANVSPNG